jgi:hypothetical protein
VRALSQQEYMHPEIVTAAMEQTSEDLALAGARAHALTCAGDAAPLRAVLGARIRPRMGAGLGRCNSLWTGLDKRKAVAAACAKSLLKVVWGSACCSLLLNAGDAAPAGRGTRMATEIVTTVQIACRHVPPHKLNVKACWRLCSG